MDAKFDDMTKRALAGEAISEQEHAELIAETSRLRALPIPPHMDEGVLKVQEMLDFIRPRIEKLTADKSVVDDVSIKIAVNIVEHVLNIPVDRDRLMKEEAEFSAYLTTNPTPAS